MFSKNTFLTLTASAIFFISCRSTETESIIDNGKAKKNATLKINLLGSQFIEYNNNSTAGVSKNYSGNFIEEQTHTVLVTPSSYLSAKLYDFTGKTEENIKAIAGLKTSAAVTTPDLGKLERGTAFRVIAYNDNDRSYVAHQDYIVGTDYLPILLKNQTNYLIAVYSYGTTTLPQITNQEKSSLNEAQLSYDNLNRDFMYDLGLTGLGDDESATLNILLRKKVAQITTTINSGTLGNISSYSNTFITPHYNNGSISLRNGDIYNRTEASAGSAIEFIQGIGSSIIVSKPTFINADTRGVKSGSFQANLTVGGINNNINLNNAFDIYPGRKYYLNVNLTKKCGAYIAPGVWKDFMCHNFGATTTEDPFSASTSIWGNKYQWGIPSVASTQDQDINKPSYIEGWNSNPAPNNALSDTNKTVNDPCPKGYRIPTASEWQGVIKYNSITYVGDGSDRTKMGVKIGDNLFLPTAGYRGTGGGTLFDLFIGKYWSTTLEVQSGASISALNINRNDPNPKGFVNAIWVGSAEKTNGINIRCIAE
ncbi:TPA: hypothetical protein ACGZ9U_003538 [Elizabethkingia anophelis]